MLGVRWVRLRKWIHMLVEIILAIIGGIGVKGLVMDLPIRGPVRFLGQLSPRLVDYLKSVKFRWSRLMIGEKVNTYFGASEFSVKNKNFFTEFLYIYLVVIGFFFATPALAQSIGSCRELLDSQSTILCLEKLVKRLESKIEAQSDVVGPIELTANIDERLLAVVRGGKLAVSKDMKDPLAVQFRNLFLSDGQVPKLCGEVNAKNSYGAYIGFRKFIATEKGEVKVISGIDVDSSVFDRSWKYYCSENIIKL
jgi:hypothetical protein